MSKALQGKCLKKSVEKVGVVFFFCGEHAWYIKYSPISPTKAIAYIGLPRDKNFCPISSLVGLCRRLILFS